MIKKCLQNAKDLVFASERKRKKRQFFVCGGKTTLFSDRIRSNQMFLSLITI